MELLGDWQFWGVVIGILVAILIPIAIFLLQRNKRKLAYYILTQTPLLSVDDEIKEKIKIRYGRKSIQNIYLVVLHFGNKGNVDIPTSDYEQPIIFSFPNSEILSSEVVEVSPKNLQPTINPELSRVTIDPILLNKGDFMVIKLLFSNYARRIEANARIMGVKEIEREDRPLRNDPYQRAQLLLTLLLVFLPFLFFFSASTGSQREPYTPSGLIVAFLLGAILALGLVSLLARQKE